jgi:hypothetical protein
VEGCLSSGRWQLHVKWLGRWLACRFISDGGLGYAGKGTFVMEVRGKKIFKKYGKKIIEKYGKNIFKKYGKRYLKNVTLSSTSQSQLVREE